jgi:hypothetical protein
MSYLKFGVHAAGVGGNYTGFGEYVAACRDAGVPCINQYGRLLSKRPPIHKE